MDVNNFSDKVKSYISGCSADDIVTLIPGGSGVFHIANVPPNRFDAAWVSPNAGRFSDAGEKVKYYANEFDVCARELGYPPSIDPSGVVFEAAELSVPVRVIDVHKLPSEIRIELFADKIPESKWEKSYVFMKVVREDPRFTNIRGAYFPSASGQDFGTGGSCLALFDEPIPTTIHGSGDYSWWKLQYGSK